MKLSKSFDSGLRQYMCKAAHPSGSVESSNPHRWRGKRLHHQGGGVCCVIVLCVVISSFRHHLLYVKKYWNISLTIQQLSPFWREQNLYFFVGRTQFLRRNRWINSTWNKNSARHYLPNNTTHKSANFNKHKKDMILTLYSHHQCSKLCTNCEQQRASWGHYTFNALSNSVSG